MVVDVWIHDKNFNLNGEHKDPLAIYLRDCMLGMKKKDRNPSEWEYNTNGNVRRLDGTLTLHREFPPFVK